MAKVRTSTATAELPARTSHAAYSRMRLNRKRLEEVPRAVAAGIFRVGIEIGEEFAKRSADSPYQPYPIHEGLPRQVGVLVYVDEKKVYGWSRRGDQPKKPRAARESVKDLSAVGFVGVGWPGRINETGTINMRAHPAFAPARDAVAPRAAGIIASATLKIIGKRP